MMNHINHLKLLLVAFLIVASTSACRTSKEDFKKDIIFSLEKTACYGTCPVYKLEVYSNGLLVLNGEKHIDKIGEYHLKISEKELDRIIEKFEKGRFWNFKPTYTSKKSDLPTTYIYFSHNGNQKRIINYDNAPKSLLKLQRELEDLLKIPRWKKM